MIRVQGGDTPKLLCLRMICDPLFLSLRLPLFLDLSPPPPRKGDYLKVESCVFRLSLGVCDRIVEGIKRTQQTLVRSSIVVHCWNYKVVPAANLLSLGKRVRV